MSSPQAWGSRAQALRAAGVALRALILDGSLPPGAGLREVSLAQAVGASRNTVREAIRAMTREGLVRHSRHRSAVVATMTEADAVDHYAMRRLLERSAMDHLGRLIAPQASAVKAATERLAKLRA